MGTVNWSVTGFGRSAEHTVSTLGQSSSGTYTSTPSATNVSGLSLNSGEVLEITNNTDCWINAQGAAAVGVGRFLPAGQRAHFQASEAVTAVSVIDV